MKPLTQEQIQTLEHSGAYMPPFFSGIWKGQYYFNGVRWHGATNRLGAGSRPSFRAKRVQIQIGADRVFRELEVCIKEGHLEG